MFWGNDQFLCQTKNKVKLKYSISYELNQMKHTNAQEYIMEITYSKFYWNRSKNVDNNTNLQ